MFALPSPRSLTWDKLLHVEITDISYGQPVSRMWHDYLWIPLDARALRNSSDTDLLRFECSTVQHCRTAWAARQRCSHHNYRVMTVVTRICYKHSAWICLLYEIFVLASTQSVLFWKLTWCFVVVLVCDLLSILFWIQLNSSAVNKRRRTECWSGGI